MTTFQQFLQQNDLTVEHIKDADGVRARLTSPVFNVSFPAVSIGHCGRSIETPAGTGKDNNLAEQDLVTQIRGRSLRLGAPRGEGTLDVPSTLEWSPLDWSKLMSPAAANREHLRFLMGGPR